MKAIFMFCLLILVYIYFLYPVIISFFPKRKSGNFSPAKADFQKVSVLIAAHNEAAHIIDKLRNALTQNYPRDRIEVILASDNSSDDTVALARTIDDSRLSIIDGKERKGKNGALNASESLATGDILVFTDANAMFTDNAISDLVKHFRDPDVGLVCGHLRYLQSAGGNVGKGEGLYFRYEAWIKRLESRLGAVTVVTGSIYAVRKRLFTPLEPDVANDFAHPVQVGATGAKVLFEPDAIAMEHPTSSQREEFARRARIVTRGFTAFGRYWKKYKMLKGIRGFCFVSHKLLRWFGPFLLLGFFFSNLFLSGVFFNSVLILQLAFYSAAIIGFSTGMRGKFFAIPYYFCLINAAALVGFLNYLRGKRQAFWDVAQSTR